MKVAVTSNSFSKNDFLKNELLKISPEAKFKSDSSYMTENQLIDYLKGYDAAIVGLDPITENVISSLPDLKMVAKYGVGLNNIDQEACKSHNVQIGWTGGVNKQSVAEMTLGFILSLTRNIASLDKSLSRGEWKKNGGRQISELKVGVIGVGEIGKTVVQMLKPFGCEIYVNDIVDIEYFANNHSARIVEKEQIFEQCDVITLHVPLTRDTRDLVNKQQFKMMKNDAVIINTARGGIINEVALKEALKNKDIAGAALDVYEVEPPTDQSFLALPTLITTPHISGNSAEAVKLMGLSAIEHIKRLI